MSLEKAVDFVVSEETSPTPYTCSLVDRKGEPIDFSSAGLKGGALDRISFYVIRSLLARIRKGSLLVEYPSGLREKISLGDPEPQAYLKISNSKFFRKVLFGGGIGFGESYVEGHWHTDDLARLLSVLLENWQEMKVGKLEKFVPRRLINLGKHFLRSNSRTGSPKNIQYHYDLSNDLYKLFLDRSMTYSSAIYSGAGESLENAQLNKLRAMIAKARIGASDHVLEIGSGFGGFAIEAAHRTGCRVTSLTLSREQLWLARQRAEEHQLSQRVSFEYCDYRDVQGVFDKIVSVEMLEAVGKEYLRAFFESCERLLQPNGIVALQVICMPDQYYSEYKTRADWIQKYIFPGSHLPSLTALLDTVTKYSGFVVQSVENIGPHYAPTLAEWNRRFQAAQKKLSGLGFDAKFKRTWEFYLASCEAEFSSGWLSNYQIVLARPNSEASKLLVTQPQVGLDSQFGSASKRSTKPLTARGKKGYRIAA